jgi:aminoglycoside phosphotransferase
MATSTIYTDTGRIELNDVTRVATEYGPTGVMLAQRQFTPEENAAADQRYIDHVQAVQNKSTIQTNLEQDYLNMQAIKAQTNADLRADPAQEIKQIADAVRRLTRLALEDYTGTD